MREIKFKLIAIHDLLALLFPINQCGNESCKDCERMNTPQIVESLKSLFLAINWISHTSLDPNKTFSDYSVEDAKICMTEISGDNKEWREKDHKDKLRILIDKLSEISKQLYQKGEPMNDYQRVKEAEFWLRSELDFTIKREKIAAQQSMMDTAMNLKTKNEA